MDGAASSSRGAVTAPPEATISSSGAMTCSRGRRSLRKERPSPLGERRPLPRKRQPLRRERRSLREERLSLPRKRRPLLEERLPLLRKRPPLLGGYYLIDGSDDRKWRFWAEIVRLPSTNERKSNNRLSLFMTLGEYHLRRSWEYIPSFKDCGVLGIRENRDFPVCPQPTGERSPIDSEIVLVSECIHFWRVPAKAIDNSHHG